jgi:hypothetical protein
MTKKNSRVFCPSDWFRQFLVEIETLTPERIPSFQACDSSSESDEEGCGQDEEVRRRLQWNDFSRGEAVFNCRGRLNMPNWKHVARASLGGWYAQAPMHSWRKNICDSILHRLYILILSATSKTITYFHTCCESWLAEGFRTNETIKFAQKSLHELK